MIFLVQFGINKLLLIFSKDHKLHSPCRFITEFSFLNWFLNYAVKNENRFLCSRDFHHQILRLSVDVQVLLFNLVFLQYIACQTSVLDGTRRMINEWE